MEGVARPRSDASWATAAVGPGLLICAGRLFTANHQGVMAVRYPPPATREVGVTALPPPQSVYREEYNL